MKENRKLKHLTLKFSGINCGYYFSQIVFFGYFGTILRFFGYGETYIGTLQSIGAASAIVLKLILGYVVDRFANPKKMVMFGYSAFTVMQILMFRFSDSEAYMMAFAFIALGSVRAILGVYESWQLKLNEQFGCNIDYGRVRAIGSISYAVIGLVIGYLIDLFGYEACIYVVVFSWAIIMLSCLGISEPKKEHSATNKVSFGDGMKVLFGNSAYTVLVFCMFLMSMTNSTVAGNFSIIMDSAGATATQIGIGFFVMAFTEFWVVYFFSNIAKHFKTHKLFIFAFFMYTVKSVLMIYSPGPEYIIASQAMQMLCFALATPASVAILDSIVSAKYKAVGLQIMHISQSLAQVAIGTLTGWIFQNYGYKMMLLATAPWASLAAIIFLIYAATHKEFVANIYRPKTAATEEAEILEEAEEQQELIEECLEPENEAEGLLINDFDFDSITSEEPENAVTPVEETASEVIGSYLDAAIEKGMPEAIYIGGFKYVPVGPTPDAPATEKG